jgi:hypothetical protein
MPLSKITIEFSKNNQKSLKVISIGKLKQDLPEIDQFLTKDRASFCLFPDAPIALAPPPSDNEIIWGGAMGIQAPTIDNPELINPAVFAIHLQNVEVFPKARLLIYDHEFVISDYLGEGGYEVAKKWLNKQWSIGPITLSRAKVIPPATHHYEIGIDFSTDLGDGNVYHWTTRVLPKIKLVRELPSHIPLIFCQDPTPIQLETLRLFEVMNPILVLELGSVSRFERYFLAEGPWAGAHLPQLDFLRENFQKALPLISKNHSRGQNCRKIFIYREDKWTRHLSNRNEIKKYLVDQGYETYSFDNVSLQETAEIFSDADEIVFEHGAVGVWLLFAKPSVKVIELLPERNHITSKTIADFFYWQAQVLQQNHRYILGKVEKLEPKLQYSIDLNQLKQLLHS